MRWIRPRLPIGRTAGRPEVREIESKSAKNLYFRVGRRNRAMKTALFSHPACLAHAPPRGHPERPERLAAVLDVLEGPEFQGLTRESAPLASRESLCRAHAPALGERILGPLDGAARRDGYAPIDADTVMSAGSAEAALRASGAVIAAVDWVMAGRARKAFCAVRPPGHHA